MKNPRNRNKRDNNLCIADFLTSARFILALPLLVLLSINQYLLALILLIIGGLTDLFDGLIARRLEGCSVWGAKMDPLADKFFLFGPLIWLGSEGLIPLWSLWLIIVRDFTVSIWRQEEKKGAPATSIGKLKTTLQFISIMLLIISQSIYEAQIYEYILVIGITTFWFSFGLSLISSYNYFRNQTMNYRD